METSVGSLDRRFRPHVEPCELAALVIRQLPILALTEELLKGVV